MLATLSRLPKDSILGLAALARADERPNKIDLTVGVYMDDKGLCPVMRAVQEAQQQWVQAEVSKTYLPPQGDPTFVAEMPKLVLGAGHRALIETRTATIQTPGGCGALRIASEVLAVANPSANVWLPNPTWPVHEPLLGSVGLKFERYEYYDYATHSLNFERMMQDLQGVKAGDAVLLHGCCHNPCGADLNAEQWQIVADLLLERGAIPLIDIAYQGLGDDLEHDALGVRMLASQLPEVLIAASCSKNLGLYRERTGATIFVTQSAEHAETALSQALGAARRLYSMPPAHGAILAGKVLADAHLNAMWQQELQSMTQRIQGLRNQLNVALSAATDRDFSFVAQEKGMFSFLGLTPAQVLQLREEQAVYMLDSSRINVAGLKDVTVEPLAQAIAGVLR